MSKIFKVSFISEGRYFVAGEPVPDDCIRPFMRPYQTQAETTTHERQLNYLLDKLYQLDAEGRRIRRDVGEMAAAIAQQEWAEDQASAEPEQSVQEALEQAQEDYQAAVEGEIADMESQAKRSEAAKEFVRREENENLANGEFDQFDTVTPQVEEMLPQQKLIRKRYVRRGILYRKAKHPNVKLKRGEPVFIRNEEGEYEKVGCVGHNGKLPVVYVQEEDQL